MDETALVEAEEEELEGMRTVHLRIPARAEYVALARLALSGLADIVELSEELVADLKLALTEAVSKSTLAVPEAEISLSTSQVAVAVLIPGLGSLP